jgi:hypothetical protein
VARSATEPAKPQFAGLFGDLLDAGPGTFLVTNSEQNKGFSNFYEGKIGMKISRSEFSNKEKTTVNRILFAIATAILLLNTLAVPTIVRAEGVGGTCTGPCKP